LIVADDASAEQTESTESTNTEKSVEQNSEQSAEISGSADETFPSAESVETKTTDKTDELEKQAVTAADDEINRILSLGHSVKQTEDAQEQIEPVKLSDVKMPGIIRLMLMTLIYIDRLFYWIPRPTKNILGIIGISTLIFAFGLWTIILFFSK